MQDRCCILVSFDRVLCLTAQGVHFHFISLLPFCKLLTYPAFPPSGEIQRPFYHLVNLLFPSWQENTVIFFSSASVYSLISNLYGWNSGLFQYLLFPNYAAYSVHLNFNNYNMPLTGYMTSHTSVSEFRSEFGIYIFIKNHMRIQSQVGLIEIESFLDSSRQNQCPYTRSTQELSWSFQ